MVFPPYVLADRKHHPPMTFAFLPSRRNTQIDDYQQEHLIVFARFRRNSLLLIYLNMFISQDLFNNIMKNGF